MQIFMIYFLLFISTFLIIDMIFFGFTDRIFNGVYKLKREYNYLVIEEVIFDVDKNYFKIVFLNKKTDKKFFAVWEVFHYVDSTIMFYDEKTMEKQIFEIELGCPMLPLSYSNCEYKLGKHLYYTFYEEYHKHLNELKLQRQKDVKENQKDIEKWIKNE